MPVDNTGGTPDSRGVTIGAVVREALAAHPSITSIRLLAAELGYLDDSTLGRTLRGLHPMTLRLVADIEEALDLGRGELLVRAGLVDLPVTAEELLRVDPALPPQHRNTLMEVYRSLATGSSSEHQSRPTRARTAKSTDRS